MSPGNFARQVPQHARNSNNRLVARYVLNLDSTLKVFKIYSHAYTVYSGLRSMMLRVSNRLCLHGVHKMTDIMCDNTLVPGAETEAKERRGTRADMDRQ